MHEPSRLTCRRRRWLPAATVLIAIALAPRAAAQLVRNVGVGAETQINLAFPVTYTGLGWYESTISYDFGDMQSATCGANTEFTVTLNADGTLSAQWAITETARAIPTLGRVECFTYDEPVTVTRFGTHAGGHFEWLESTLGSNGTLEGVYDANTLRTDPTVWTNSFDRTITDFGNVLGTQSVTASMSFALTSGSQTTTTTTSSSTTYTTTPPTTTTTVPPASPCGNTYPACNGACPPGEECIRGFLTCGCTATTTTTMPQTSCGSTFPSCNGQCPPGEECIRGFLTCGCSTATTTTTLSPSHCGLTFPACDGQCPPGEECVPGFLTCGCTGTAITTTTVPQPTCGTSYPKCDGPCPLPQVCIRGFLTCGCGTTTTTVPPPGCGPSYPRCDGDCPPGTGCILGFLTCGCWPLPPTTTSTTTTSTSTTTTSTSITTTTLEVGFDCEGSLPPLCFGNCEPGLTCVAEANACVCRPSGQTTTTTTTSTTSTTTSSTTSTTHLGPTTTTTLPGMPLPGTPPPLPLRVGGARKISQEYGGLYGPLADGGEFGRAVAPGLVPIIDGKLDLLVGAPGSAGDGELWALFLGATGNVVGEHDTSRGVLDGFASAVALIGDLDGNGIEDYAVGAPFDDDGGSDHTSDLGAVWIVFMANDGIVGSAVKISSTKGGFGGDLKPGDLFGSSVVTIGDVDGDGTPELAVGAPGDDDGAGEGVDGALGAVWLLSLRPDGSVKGERKISATTGGFTGDLDELDLFGIALAWIPDLDGNGVAELAVGAPGDDARGAVWLLFLDADGTVAKFAKIGRASGFVDGDLRRGDLFGSAIVALGPKTLAVGSPGDGDGGKNRGAVRLIDIFSDGSVRRDVKISDCRGNFQGDLDDGDRFGSSLARLGDINGDEIPELVVGAPRDDDDGEPGDDPDADRGAIYLLFLESGAAPDLCAPVTTTTTLPENPVCGDPTLDGIVTATDALHALQVAVGTRSCNVVLCDTNGSGTVTATDALAILRFAVGLSVTLQCPVSPV